MIHILKRLQQIVGDQLEIDASKVKANTDLVKELGADSLDVIEIILKIEYEFEINIDDPYASKIATLQDVVNYLEKNYK